MVIIECVLVFVGVLWRVLVLEGDSRCVLVNAGVCVLVIVSAG